MRKRKVRSRAGSSFTRLYRQREINSYSPEIRLDSIISLISFLFSKYFLQLFVYKYALTTNVLRMFTQSIRLKKKHKTHTYSINVDCSIHFFEIESTTQDAQRGSGKGTLRNGSDAAALLALRELRLCVQSCGEQWGKRKSFLHVFLQEHY